MLWSLPMKWVEFADPQRRKQGAKQGARMDVTACRRYRKRSGPCGGTGRRTRLKIARRKAWGFDSLHGHHGRSPPLFVLLTCARVSGTSAIFVHHRSPPRPVTYPCFMGTILG